jgi:hypothetical protein
VDPNTHTHTNFTLTPIKQVSNTTPLPPNYNSNSAWIAATRDRQVHGVTYLHVQGTEYPRGQPWKSDVMFYQVKARQ